MNDSGKYYQHTGAVGLIGICCLIIVGGIGTLLLSVIYVYLHFIPIRILKLFLPFAFGAGVGIVVNLGGFIGKVRNKTIMAFFGLFFGTLGVYFGWVVWIYAFSPQGTLILDPFLLLDFINQAASIGSGQIFGWTQKGAIKYAFFGLEAIIILGTATLLAYMALVASTPFCERCKRWVGGITSFSPLELIVDESELRGGLERGDYAPIKALRRIDADAKTFTKIDLFRCNKCNDSHFISVKSVEIKKEFPRKLEKSVIEHLIIGKDAYNMLMGDLQPHQEVKSVETDKYVIDVPYGDQYTIETKQEGIVRIRQTRPGPIDSGGKPEITLIQISYNNVPPESWELSEEQVAEDYRDGEIRDMKIRGELQGEYELHDVRKDLITINDMKFYTLSYRTVGGKKFGDDKMQVATLHLYFPPNYIDEHVFYLFLISLFCERDDTKAEHITSIEPIIKRFRLKQ